MPLGVVITKSHVEKSREGACASGQEEELVPLPVYLSCTPNLEAEGYVWFSDLPNQFKCSCQGTNFDGSVRISVCEASFSRTHNWVFDCKRWRIVAARLRHLLGLFLGSIKAPVPSSRPGIIPATARWPCQIRRLRRDRSHAQPPLGGEPGEDPRFATARRGAMLRPGHRGAPISHGHSQAVAGPWRWCPNRDRSSPEAPPP